MPPMVRGGWATADVVEKRAFAFRLNSRDRELESKFIYALHNH